MDDSLMPAFDGAILISNRSFVKEALRPVLKDMGVTEFVPTDTVDACIEKLFFLHKAVLIIDWEVGQKDVVSVLEASRSKIKVETRPILLLAVEIDEVIVATAAEYNVTMLQSGQISKQQLLDRLAALSREIDSTSHLKATLVQVAYARQRNDWEMAMQLLAELFKKHPENPRVMVELAENHIELGQWDLAMNYLDPLRTLNPPYLRAIHLFGRCLARQGKTEDAYKILQKANLLNPFNVERLVEVGNILLKLDSINEARKSFETALSVDKNAKNAMIGKTKCMLIEGEVNDALNLIREMSSDRELASVFNTAAVLSIRRGRYTEGMTLYETALRAVAKNIPVQAQLHFNMGIGFRRWSKLDQALSHFEKAVSLDPAYEKARVNAMFVANKLNRMPNIPPDPNSAKMLQPLRHDVRFNMEFDEELDKNDEVI